MTTYRRIHGRSIQAVTTDPTGDITEGQVWYNTTSDTFKSVVALEAWSSTSNMINKVTQGEAGTDGPRDAFAIWGGRTIPAVTTNLTEEYNGSGWSAGGNLGTAARKREGGGTLSAAWCANGEDSSPTSYISNVEEYNGTSWSEETNTPAASSLIGGSGPQTAGIATLGQLAPGPYPKATLEYDGSSWTSGGTMSVSRTSSSAGQVGPQTAAIITGGEPTPIANTESYDGTSWSEVGDLVTALGQCSDGTFGDQTAAVQCGGKTSPSPGAGVTTSQTWNGTSWSSGTAMGQARKSHSTSGTSTQGLACSGQTSTTPSALTSAEEYNKSANVITAAAWASASNFPGPASSVRGFGTVHSASVAIGGETGPGPTVSSCYSYDGSSWTSVPAIPNTARNVFAYGTQTAGLYSGGNTSPGQTPISNASAEWDGSGWTGGPTVPTSRGFGASSGVQTSALSTAGDQGGSPFAATAVDSYNGSTWTSETAYPGGAYGMTGCGRSETTAFVFGGEAPYPGSNPNVATYNGSAWTTTATPVNTLLPSNTQQASSYGEQDNCIAFGGSSSQSATAGWDGTAWSTRPSMGTGRSAGGTGISTDALAFCGSPVPNGGNKTEEFIGETSALNVKTLTQS